MLGMESFEVMFPLRTNGGFAYVQMNTSNTLAEEIKFIALRVKVDGKQYQFRLKGAVGQTESYVQPFVTSGSKKS